MVNRRAMRRRIRLKSPMAVAVVATHMRIESTSIWLRSARSPAAGHRFGVFLENFFVAKFRDSESVKRVFRRSRFAHARHRALAREFCCNQEMPVPQGFLAYLTRHCLRFLRVPHRRDSTACAHRLDRAAQLRSHRHQHFLKWHSGFFISLVYSNCSASRIAGCTTLTSHLTL
jgi:hypothetical protein